MQIFKAELKSWMLGEFAPLKSKHDDGVAKANQQNLLNVIVNEVKQSFQLHNNGLPRRYAPRNDDNTYHIHSMLWTLIRLFFDVILDFWRKPIRRGFRTKMQIFKAELKSWMLGEFAPLKSKHDCNVCGRSMIEMLGVLAIIGVLSVGGIAGYSKAMEKFKLNKALDEYSMLIYGLLENLDYIQKLNSQSTNLIESAGLIDFAFGLNLIPDTYHKINFRRMYDPYGNIIQLFSRNNRLVIDLYLGGTLNENGNIAHPANFSAKLCQSLMTDLVKPLHSAVYYIFATYKSDSYYYGDNFCTKNRNCLSAITVSEINDICNYCIDKEKICAIVLEF